MIVRLMVQTSACFECDCTPLPSRTRTLKRVATARIDAN